MKKIIFSCIVALFFTTAHADEKAKILVLGTFHFANPQADVIKTDVFDVTSEAGQQQVLALLEQLNQFKPTKILLEFTPEKSESINQEYQAYLADNYVLSTNEIDQLGYRLAAMNNHEKVFGIDNRDIEWLGGEFFEYAKQKEPDVHAQVQQMIADITSEIEHNQKTKNLHELIRIENTPEMLRKNLGFYLKYNYVDAGDGFAGANSTASWFERNIRMHGLIQKHAGPGERILAIVGSGHAAILNILLDQDATIDRVYTLDYLP